MYIYIKALISIFLFHVAPWFAELNRLHLTLPHPLSSYFKLHQRLQDMTTKWHICKVSFSSHLEQTWSYTDTIKDFIGAAFALSSATLPDLFFLCVSVKNLEKFKLLVQLLTTNKLKTGTFKTVYGALKKKGIFSLLSHR